MVGRTHQVIDSLIAKKREVTLPMMEGSCGFPEGADIPVDSSGDSQVPLLSIGVDNSVLQSHLNGLVVTSSTQTMILGCGNWAGIVRERNSY